MKRKPKETSRRAVQGAPRRAVAPALPSRALRSRSFPINFDQVRSMVDQMPAILWTTDRDLRITASVGGGLAFLDQKPGETVGKTMYEALGTRDASFLPLAAHFRALAGEHVSYGMEWKGRMYQTHLEPYLDGRERVVGVIGISVDITERKAAESSLVQSESLKRAIFDASLDCIVTMDEKGKIVEFNPASERTFGYSREGAVGRDLADLLIPPRLRDEHRKGLEYFGLTGQGRVFGRRIEMTAMRVDGSEFPVEIAIVPIRQGNRALFSGFLRDISEQKLAQSSLRESEERYRRLVEDSPDMIAVHRDDRYVYVNAAGARLLGARSPEEIVGRSIYDTIHPDYRELVRSRLERIQEEGVPSPLVERKLMRLDGTFFDAEVAASPVTLGGEPAIQVIARDVTHRKEAEARTMIDSLYDPLTGLPNRALFMDRLGQAIGRARRREGFQFAALCLDLDRFKVINDSLGHAIGDQLLVGTARRIEACLRPGDTAARLSGDEFAIFLDEVQSVRDATRVAERVQKELSTPFNLGGHEVFTSVSVGISLSAAGYESGDEVLRDADTAMYRAKSAGKGRHEVFNADMHQSAVTLLRLETDLRRAIDRGEFRLVYQPIVSLETGGITGFEALLRWQHPERGVVSPMDFIPVAEETGLILPVGWWALREACRQMKEWVDRRDPQQPLVISVNLSPKQLSQPDLIGHVQAALRDSGLDPKHLRLEITESVLMENAIFATYLLSELKALNVSLYIDDFGTGYSSLSYLYQFPIDTLKVDRSFVSGAEDRADQAEILRTIVTLAHSLGMDVIAEGVETLQQVERLRTLRCKYAQGFYFSRPVDGGKAGELLQHAPAW